MNRKFGLSAAALRWIALGCMLLDHLWGTLIPGNIWMTCLGRIAFPIFAFQIAEGYLHTHDFAAYRKRLLIMALLSEIPFDLMLYSTPFFPFHQNVVFTLLIGLQIIRVIDRTCRKDLTPGKAALALIGLGLLSLVLLPDYGFYGVATVVSFYLFRGTPAKNLMLLAVMVLIHCFGFQGQDLALTVFGKELFFPIQGFALLALIPIGLSSGKRGTQGKALQVLSYCFYPVHMLILYVLTLILL